MGLQLGIPLIGLRSNPAITTRADAFAAVRGETRSDAVRALLEQALECLDKAR
jgi:hypothetical protein